ncbi:MAG: hypothetical protein F6K09_10265 [Merismopedia sp. SIO2A8]|nr:hypothetical protein [Merismopedia sp. SIO2A8]
MSLIVGPNKVAQCGSCDRPFEPIEQYKRHIFMGLSLTTATRLVYYPLTILVPNPSAHSLKLLLCQTLE